LRAVLFEKGGHGRSGGPAPNDHDVVVHGWDQYTPKKDR
jgi:hypothetical protein